MANTPLTLKGPSLFPRGSEWRRWDLHVHTPASVLENRFKDWDSYVNELEKKGDGISVLGATDYCSIEGYKRLQEYRARGRLSSFNLILPNIEFRIHPETSAGAAINIHLLISPDDPDHMTKVEQALQKLTFTYDRNEYACTRNELVALGKAHDPKQTDDDVAFRHGVNNFKPSFDVFRDWYHSQGWLTTNSLVVISNGKDGASGLSKDAGFSATRDELYRFSQLIFSGNPKDREYFIGRGTDSVEEVVRKAGSLKPCIHGSDAHGASELFAPDQKRYCWIKADPSFEGLRQIVHEPEDRVHIGPSAPQAIDESKVIESVKISGGSHWFSESEIQLNSGLITIIGEKGSGKTAIVDLIAYACGAWNGEESSSSFIRKARPHLGGVTAKVGWLDGRFSDATLDGDPPDKLPEVRYLSQDFVEELCSQDITGKRLLEEIEEVIFSYIDEPDRLGASSFAELRRLKTERLTSRRVNIHAKLSQLNAEIVELENEVASKAQKIKLIEKHTQDIAAIDKQLPALQSTVDKKIAGDLAKEKEKLKQANSQSAASNRKLNQITSIRGRITDFQEILEDRFNELRDLLREIGLTESEIARFKPQFPSSFDAPLARLEKELQRNAVALKGDPQKPIPNGNTIADIQARIAGLEKKLAADDKQRDRLLALQNQRAKIDGERERLKREVEKIDTTVSNNLSTKREVRWKIYLSYFNVLTEEEGALKSLYTPLGKVIAEDVTGTKSGFELTVRQIADKESWVKAGSDLLDMRRREVPLRDKGFLRKIEKDLVVSWQTGNQVEIRRGLEAVIAELGEGAVKLDDLLVSHASRMKLYDWLFSPEHVRLEYSLSYQGVDLDVLSPGTRGIVLLVLYLAMDQQDRRPLIIDQPEGNLDNSSIYDSLVPFLRRAKRGRQVILVTHNPNLVITTDADQVIVATGAKKPNTNHPVISYAMGSLENTGGIGAIREQAVRLLEGGRKPFKVRENRYAID